MLDGIFQYLQWPFVRYALIVGVLIAMCASLLGVTLVLKRFSFIGDGLSHVAFGAVAIASVLKLNNNLWVVLPVTVAAAVLLLHTGQRAKVHGDASLAMLSVGAMAIGYLLLHVFPSSGNISGDVCSTLFGSTSILTLSEGEVWFCLGLSLVVVTVFVLLYNRLFALTFDEPFAAATGLRTKAYNLLLAILIALVIVLAMNLVGSLLISALVVFPALSAMRVFRSFRAVTIASGVVSVVGALCGMLISIAAQTPVGATIVAVYIVIYLAFTIAGNVKRR